MNFNRAILTIITLTFFAFAPFQNTYSLPTDLIYAPADFSALMEQENPTVVTLLISNTTKESTNTPSDPEVTPGPVPPPGTVPPTPRPGQKPKNSSGSGFIITSDGYIVTNAHVVANAEEVVVKLSNGKKYKAKIIGVDVRSDVAVVKIDATNLQVVRIGDPNKMKLGQLIFTIGTPFGFENTVSTGIISGKDRMLPDTVLVKFMQTTAPTNPGNSGGPLFNQYGEVIGINSQIYSQSGGFEGIAFAIPIDTAMNVVNQLRTNGKVTRSRIGVVIQEMSEEISQKFGFSEPKGALVVSVEKNGPSEIGGLKSGDVILVVDDIPLLNSRDLPILIAAIKPGREITITVWRDNAEQILHIKTAEIK